MLSASALVEAAIGSHSGHHLGSSIFGGQRNIEPFSFAFHKLHAIGTKRPYEQISYAKMANFMQLDMQQVPRSLRTSEMMAMATWMAKSGG